MVLAGSGNESGRGSGPAVAHGASACGRPTLPVCVVALMSHAHGHTLDARDTRNTSPVLNHVFAFE